MARPSRRGLSAAALVAGGAGLLASVGGAARAATVDLQGPAAATPGGAVTVTVALSPDLSDVYALQGALAYDPAVLSPLESAEGAAQGFYAGAETPFPGETLPKDADLFRLNASTPGQLLFGYLKNPSNPAGSPSHTVPSPALRITFNVAPGARGTTTLRLSPATVNGQDFPALILGAADGSPRDATVGAPLTLSLGRRGDVNGDGTVTVDDVLLALQAAGGETAIGGTSLSMANADVWPAGSPDGRVTTEDALRVWRFLNGLENDLN